MVVQRQNPAYRLARGFQKAPVRELFCFTGETPVTSGNEELVGAHCSRTPLSTGRCRKPKGHRSPRARNSDQDAPAPHKPKAGIKLVLDPRFIVRNARKRSMRVNDLGGWAETGTRTPRTCRRLPLQVNRDRRSRNHRRHRRSRRSPSQRWMPQERPNR